VTSVAELGDLIRVENPRPLIKYLGLIPSEYSSGERRRQGSITKAGNTHARRALVEGAWAYRYPANVSRHLPLRLEPLPKPLQDLSWKAPVGLGTRLRCLLARGKHANQVVVAIARELVGFLWAILVPRVRQVPDGYKSGGSQPTDISRINRRIDWLRLFRWITSPRGHHHEEHQLRIFMPALDIESHINAGRQVRPKAGAQQTLFAVACTPWFGWECHSPRDADTMAVFPDPRSTPPH
jgi:transposase IS116/IS110/IS902 family protein